MRDKRKPRPLNFRQNYACVHNIHDKDWFQYWFGDTSTHYIKWNMVLAARVDSSSQHKNKMISIQLIEDRETQKKRRRWEKKPRHTAMWIFSFFLFFRCIKKRTLFIGCCASATLQIALHVYSQIEYGSVFVCVFRLSMFIFLLVLFRLFVSLPHYFQIKTIRRYHNSLFRLFFAHSLLDCNFFCMPIHWFNGIIKLNYTFY